MECEGQSKRVFLSPVWGMGVSLLVGNLVVALILGGSTLSYRDRGDRREGVLPKAVSGYDLELLGAMVESHESHSNVLPSELELVFYLDHQEDVYVKIRERYPRKYYWLDDVRPGEPWQAKRENRFKWPTDEVLLPLGLSPADLVGLVRLGRETPSHEERVAPVLLGGPASIPTAVAYRFTFKANAPARIRYNIFAAGTDDGIESVAAYRQVNAGQPFDLRWEAGTRPEGYYRLYVDGYFLTDNRPITGIVEFFHTPSWLRRQ